MKRSDRPVRTHRLEHDQLRAVSGGVRYGSGPDFDSKESTAGNYVIGVGTTTTAIGFVGAVWCALVG